MTALSILALIIAAVALGLGLALFGNSRRHDAAILQHAGAIRDLDRVLTELRGDGSVEQWAPTAGPHEPTTGRERGESLERFINRTITSRMETFRLGVEQQLPLLAALRYATDDTLVDVVVGLRKALVDRDEWKPLPAATPGELAGHQATQLVGGVNSPPKNPEVLGIGLHEFVTGSDGAGCALCNRLASDELHGAVKAAAQ